MAKEYANAEDVHKRLADTVVFYNNRPYCVVIDRPVPSWRHIVIHDFTVFFPNKEEVEKHDPIIVRHDDPNLVTAAPELGNINYAKDVFYVSRRPLRRQNQGMMLPNLYTNPRIGNYGWYYDKSVWQMLMNIYPKQDEALEMIRQLDAKRVAISRTISIGYSDRSSSIGMFLGSSAGHKLIAVLDRFERFRLIEGEDTSFLRRFLNKTGVVRNVA